MITDSSPHSAAVMRQAYDADLEGVCAFLSANMHRGLNAEVYRAAFNYPWRPADTPFGFVLLHDDQIVGFIGCIWADRVINGSIHRFCNLSNWCVLSQFRRQSLDLFFAILRSRNVTFTDLSPIPEIEKLLVGLRFQVVNLRKWFTIPGLHLLGTLQKTRIIANLEKIPDYLDPQDLKIFRDHQNIGCLHTVLADGHGVGYVVSRKRKRKNLIFSEILYTSDRAMLRRNFERVKLSILRRDRTCILAVDEHIYGDRPRGFLSYHRPEYFRSATLQPFQIDHLYSETALI